MFILPIAAAAVSSSNYSQPMQDVNSGGANLNSSNYSGASSAGGSAAGKTANANFTLISGGLSMMSVLSTADVTAPVISNVKIDEKAIVTGDYIQKEGILTASITDETVVDRDLSSIEVDGVLTSFSQLTGVSTYNATTGTLFVKLNFSNDGGHNIKIYATDIYANTSNFSTAVKVDNGDLKATGVYVYPNPYRGVGNMAIGYQLNKAANTSIFIFNAVGRLIYRQNFVLGAEGAHIGYNEVSWNVHSDFGEMLANDIYFLRIVSDNKPVGRAKIAVIK